MDELKELHLIDRIRQRSHDCRDLQEKIGVGVGETISHRGPVIEPMIQTANPRLLLVVASAQGGIKGRDRRLYRRPLLAAILVLGGAGQC